MTAEMIDAQVEAPVVTSAPAEMIITNPEPESTPIVVEAEVPPSVAEITTPKKKRKPKNVEVSGAIKINPMSKEIEAAWVAIGKDYTNIIQRVREEWDRTVIDAYPRWKHLPVGGDYQSRYRANLAEGLIRCKRDVAHLVRLRILNISHDGISLTSLRLYLLRCEKMLVYGCNWNQSKWTNKTLESCLDYIADHLEAEKKKEPMEKLLTTAFKAKEAQIREAEKASEKDNEEEDSQLENKEKVAVKPKDEVEMTPKAEEIPAPVKVAVVPKDECDEDEDEIPAPVKVATTIATTETLTETKNEETTDKEVRPENIAVLRIPCPTEKESTLRRKLEKIATNKVEWEVTLESFEAYGIMEKLAIKAGTTVLEATHAASKAYEMILKAAGKL